MAKMPKNQRYTAHKERMRKKKAARDGITPPSAATGLIARYRRLSNLQRRAIQVTAGLTVAGAIALGVHVLPAQKSRYCFEPLADIPNHTMIGATVTLNDANIDYTKVAEQLSDIMNQALNMVLGIRSYAVKDTQTGQIVGGILGDQYVQINKAVSPKAQAIPEHGQFRMEIKGKEYVLPLNARFTVSPNMRTIKIGSHEFDASDIIGNGHDQDEPAGAMGYMYVRPVFAVKGPAPECSDIK